MDQTSNAKINWHAASSALHLPWSTNLTGGKGWGWGSVKVKRDKRSDWQTLVPLFHPTVVTPVKLTDETKKKLTSSLSLKAVQVYSIVLYNPMQYSLFSDTESALVQYNPMQYSVI